MLKLYHLLVGPDDPTLKHAFIKSFNKELSEEVFKIMKTKNKDESNSTLGEIFRFVLSAVEKLCSQHSYFKKLLKQDPTLKKVCKRLDLSIKCYDKKRLFLQKQEEKALKKIQALQKSNSCFICNKKGHFAKNCPNKQKSVQLIQFLAMKTGFDPDDTEVKSIFSLNDEPILETIISLKVYDSSAEEAPQDLFKISPVSQPS